MLDRASCVIGAVLDACAPKVFVQGEHSHALKVTFTHAVIIQLAQDANHQHIAVIEDDIVLIPRYQDDTITGFSSLLNSNLWSFIRVGFRPYFLQEAGAKPCPKQCRCEFRKEFGENLCEVRSPGCDLRSSDFYILSARFFEEFKDRLLDINEVDEKRVVDMYPMRSLGSQWLLLPQASFQRQLDIPVDYQIGIGALYVKKCAGPRPVPNSVSADLFDNLDIRIKSNRLGQTHA